MATGIKILKALYGAGSSVVDVTAAVSSHVKDGTLNLVVTPDALNVTDPAPGQLKQLDVTYTINNGQTNSQIVKDNEMLLVSAPPERLADGLQILKAEYGYPGNFTDVTDAIQNYVKNGSINVKVSHSNVGVPDPNPNKQKSLEVEYTLNGAKNIISVQDGKSFTVSAPPLEAADGKTPSGHVFSVLGMLYTNAFYFLAMFLYVISIYVMADFGGPEGSYRTLYMLLGIVFPFIAFWGLPIYVFGRRLFYITDLVI